MKAVRSCTAIALCLVSAAFASVPQMSLAQAPAARAQPPVYRQVSATIAARVEDLLARMTLEEKVAQLTSLWDNKALIQTEASEFDPAKRALNFPAGIGQIARPSDRKGPSSPRVERRRDAAESIRYVNAVQRDALEHTRLGIPVIFHEEGLHGFAAFGATSFPQAIGLASSWDPDLVREVNTVTAREMRARGVSIALSPVIDVARDPRWGRIEETFGEDPFLVGRMGVAAIEGLQGRGKAELLAPSKVFATLKHFTGHGQPESGTNVGPAQLSERVLRENFFPPFETAIAETGVRLLMPSYNEIDGVPSHMSRWLLRDILRGEWNYQGSVISDYYALDDLVALHKVATDKAEAARLALAAGVDFDLPTGGSYGTLIEQVRSGKVSEAAVDVAVRRMLRLKFEAGLFDKPYADLKLAEAITNNAEARALARKAAARSVVLLKNDGALPLKVPAAGAGPQPRIAVIGPSAAVARLGGYYGDPPTTVSILEGLRSKLAGRAQVVFAQGVKITEDDDWWADEVKLADPAENRRRIAEAVAAARDCDQIVLTLGDTEQTSREGWAKNHLGDRDSLDLVGEQQELFDALKALGKPITVVLINGRPASIVKIAEQANAIVEGWYLGEQGGSAMADILLGDANPGGKLPLTFPRSAGQIPAFYNAKPSARRGYLFDSAEPLYPFGFGLSYTSFELGAPQLSAASIPANGSVKVTVTVRNTGQRSGDEVVQLYVRDVVSSVTRPIKELKGFERISLQPGEVRAVTFTLGTEAFRMWNAAMKRVVEPGEFEIMVGSNSRDLKAVTLKVVP